MKKLDLTDLEIVQGFTQNYSITEEELKTYLCIFDEDFDKSCFKNRYDSRSSLFRRDFLSYTEIMSGCYDVIDNKWDTMGWNLARNKFIDMIESGEVLVDEENKYKVL